MRIVGVDVGERRIGLAVSDASGTVARPVATLERLGGEAEAVVQVSQAIHDIEAAEAEQVDAVVIGLPSHLDGTPSEQTSRVRRFAAALGGQIAVPIVLQDERLSSHEADARLALTEPDWRRRKGRLDAAAAAVFLQDYLDSHRARAGDESASS